MQVSWDIFCDVVDNYGDVGVTWRLARQLVAEHGFAVRLWINDLSAFVRLCPQADPVAARQCQAGVEVCHWPEDWQPASIPDVVLEAFACRLPEAYTQAMLQRSPRPVWLNLDYLSAEDWVSGCHGLPSPQANGLKKFFFFPGFTGQTGGLLREQSLIAQRQAFQADPAAQQDFLRRLGVQPESGARLISLFAYENPALGSWLDQLLGEGVVTHLLVPQGRIVGDLQRWLGEGGLQAGAIRRRGALTIQVLPFVAQEQYDRLLWCCDFNVVRGEDSFVRAQWAARPMLWHIYQQQDDAHQPKLEAFLALYLATLPAEAAQATAELWRAWSAGEELQEGWQQLNRYWPQMREHAEHWCQQQAARSDLASALVQFYRNSL
ncbi:elongation factor P maturation arginine rhamnosyltransferase EarP [Pseudomonas sp. 21LCFQ010]|uniref:elongation factor P maturation arginine rhamnosyltransferase EarP n=1 Tax=Pseudomonas sp. 21LCFQ010 TaxID=2957506 RepID=UPI0020971112|nr:elongation factor P maturation arginine rhamnosyltransferase EarP [Pseudomonas sp. 21LCFQ010]MCO8163100.1 elongation factor P maturation arginine rhamnosyltransferase EarP [Pseudomonas sp. 21LCFQ010]